MGVCGSKSTIDPVRDLKAEFESAKATDLDLRNGKNGEQMDVHVNGGENAGGAKMTMRNDSAHGDGRCVACSQAFSSGSTVVKNFGRKWHLEHYVCGACGTNEPIEENAYLVEDKLLCEDHYRKRDAEVCSACGEEILGEKVRAGEEGKSFHPSCYCCTECGTSLLQSDAFEHNGQLLCKKDFRKLTAERCTVCGDPLVDRRVVIISGNKRHEKCLKCKSCSRVIGRKEQYIDFEDEIYCEEHDPEKNLITCGVCGQSLLGKAYLNNMWGDLFCESHEEKLLECSNCGADTFQPDLRTVRTLASQRSTRNVLSS
uniref:LIM zinc-binding domain-containing protein n=1 Tax=Rhodosorus marinus TaxID=101924 RepID=A0A7S3ED78_9RHOD|mmetsp:Transcript_26839/g.104193  ORF Transcript_26839/g.104193 Transcript_26839/m.104193 type:complete len:314 (+) Transcript_26839:223-1164(+)